MTCNGWSNRETWVVNLWFGDGFQDLLSHYGKVTPAMLKSDVEFYLSERKLPGFVQDMLNTSAINYEELAEHYNE